MKGPDGLGLEWNGFEGMGQWRSSADVAGAGGEALEGLDGAGVSSQWGRGARRLPKSSAGFLRVPSPLSSQHLGRWPGADEPGSRSICKQHHKISLPC